MLKSSLSWKFFSQWPLKLRGLTCNGGAAAAELVLPTALLPRSLAQPHSDIRPHRRKAVRIAGLRRRNMRGGYLLGSAGLPGPKGCGGLYNEAVGNPMTGSVAWAKTGACGASLRAGR